MNREIMIRSAMGVCFASVLAGASQAQVVRVDFGAGSGSGVETASPDSFGNYWNNNTGPVSENLVDTGNANTGIDINFTSDFGTNGGAGGGGLLSPQASLLGELAVESATRDYFWFQSAMSFELSDLDPSKEYDFRFFGTRATDSTRETRYTAEGDTSGTADLVTSGAGIGTGGANGNNDTIVSIMGIQPTAAGVITISTDDLQGGFHYLGIMEITVVPAPGAAALALAGLACLRRRR